MTIIEEVRLKIEVNQQQMESSFSFNLKTLTEKIAQKHDKIIKRIQTDCKERVQSASYDLDAKLTSQFDTLTQY